MDPGWISAPISAIGVLIAYVVARQKSRSEAHNERKDEINEVKDAIYERVGNKLNEIHEDVGSVSDRVDSMALDISALKVTVAVHDDRFQRPLRAVNDK
jgi:uncharacterized membrane protein